MYLLTIVAAVPCHLGRRFIPGMLRGRHALSNPIDTNTL